RRGPPAPGGEAPARGRDLGQHPVVQEQHRFGGQLVRLPQELRREPRRELPATGRCAHPLIRHPADRGGRRPGAPDRGRAPLQPISHVSHASTLTEALKLNEGRTITALQTQFEYLEYATRYVGSISPDPATKDVLARWTYVLTTLETDPMQLSRELDWVIK